MSRCKAQDSSANRQKKGSARSRLVLPSFASRTLKPTVGTQCRHGRDTPHRSGNFVRHARKVSPYPSSHGAIPGCSVPRPGDESGVRPRTEHARHSAAVRCFDSAHRQ